MPEDLYQQLQHDSNVRLPRLQLSSSTTCWWQGPIGSSGGCSCGSGVLLLAYSCGAGLAQCRQQLQQSSLKL